MEWEYLVIKMSTLWASEVETTDSDRPFDADDAAENLTDIFNKLGQERWELHSWIHETNLTIWKRPKEQA